MKKDVIYIDIEDDITAIIGKVKSADAQIIALVPPKRAGALQSVVNLKLLQRASAEGKKRVVLITSDHTLTALAAGVKLPVARNLQSRPEVPDMPALKNDAEEVINGAELPVGDVASSLGAAASVSTAASAADEISNTIDLKDAQNTSQKPVMPKKSSFTPKKFGNKFNIPNFASFRTKLFVFGGAGTLLLLFLVWALVFAPHATVTISAKTTAVNIDRTLTLNPKAAQSTPATLVLKPNVQELKKSVATEFDATGTKDIGNKASGTITIKNCDSATSFTLAAGTTFTASSGHKFTSNAATTVTGFSGSASACRNTGAGAGTGDAAVTAADIGPEYNVAAGSFTVSGVSGDVYASSSAAMQGGTREKATVVSSEDVEKAKQQLAQQNATNDAKTQLKQQFTGDFVIIDESFTASEAAPAVSPAIGEQAKRAKVSIETTYTMVALDRNDAKGVLTLALAEALKDKTDQQQYSLGDNSITFQVFQKLDDGSYKARMVATGYIGPKIDTKKLAEQMAGKRYGEIQAAANSIPGIERVDINFSPFWVTNAPSADKIDIKFSVASNDK